MSFLDVRLTVLAMLVILVPGTYVRAKVAKARLARDFHTSAVFDHHDEDAYQLLNTIAQLLGKYRVRYGPPSISPYYSPPPRHQLLHESPDLALVIWHVAIEDDS